jgi:DNA polymerase elongation subunit (family B)
MNYYTNISIQGSKILFRGIVNGRRIKEKVSYSPTLYVPTKKKSEYKTLFNENLEPISFESVREAKEFFNSYKEVENFKIYGQERFEYAFIADNYKDQIEWNIKDLNVFMIDIEVGSENGFPDPYKANEPITAITVHKLNGQTNVFGCGDFVNIDDNVTYHKCRDEYDLCKKFLNFWTLDYPDIYTGWNVRFFDIPYLVNRFNKILGEDEVKKLSPWNFVREKTVNGKHGKQLTAYILSGISCLDYLEMYKGFAPNGKSKESYSLDFICNDELGMSKLDYEEYDNLHQLYKLNYQKFIEYNIKDVDLVLKLEEKLKLLELCITLAYDTKTNYEDVFMQTVMWDSLIYSTLLNKGIVVPPKTDNIKNNAFEGAYVKDPQVGMHINLSSFDLDSLYPHLLMQYNLSPETLVEPKDYNEEMRRIVSEGVAVDKLLNKSIDLSNLKGYTLTPNGQFFRTDKQGFLAKMMEDLYEDRKKHKNTMIEYKKQYEKETDPKKKNELENLISRYNNLQLAKKLSLNSAYGVLGSQYFRFYDIRLALAVTMAGKLSIRWIENKLNNYMNSILKTNKDYVIASDTDSIYLGLNGIIESVFTRKEDKEDKIKIINFMDKICQGKIQPYIDKSYQELADYTNAYKQKMRMKRECLADKGIWVAKKRYILNVYDNEGVRYKEPQLKIMGLEVVKSSTPQVVRKKMYELIGIIINYDENKVHEFIASFKEEFKNMPVQNVSFPRGVTGLNEYSNSVSTYIKGTPIHVRGALIYNKFLREYKLENKYQMIKEGEKLKFTYLKVPNPFKEDVISFPNKLPAEFNLNDFIDYETQFEKTFISPMQIILDCIGWKTEKQNNLESFFN